MVRRWKRLKFVPDTKMVSDEPENISSVHRQFDAVCLCSHAFFGSVVSHSVIQCAS